MTMKSTKIYENESKASVSVPTLYQYLTGTGGTLCEGAHVPGNQPYNIEGTL